LRRKIKRLLFGGLFERFHVPFFGLLSFISPVASLNRGHVEVREIASAISK